MAADPTKILFDSRYPIDKIVDESNALTATAPVAEPTVPVKFDSSIAHDAGASCVVSGMFSIDNTNFYPFGAFITGEYVAGGNTEYVTLEAYCDATTVYFSGITAYFDAQPLYYYFFMESIA